MNVTSKLCGLKFRVWDPSERFMIYKNAQVCYGFAIEPEGILMRDWGDDGWQAVDPKDYVVMEYTRLKDSTGREIYEGDIIDIFDWGIKANKFLHRAIVTWDADQHGWGVRPFYDADPHDYFRRVEIIGNIFENPEKPEEKKCK